MGENNSHSPRKWGVLAASTALGLLAVLAAGSPASASETWTFGAYNCGSALILTSERSNDDATHVQSHLGVGRSRNFPLAAGVYVWTYYNSGYTNSGWSSISSVADVSSGNRICDY